MIKVAFLLHLSRRAKACTHFEKRLKFRGLDDPRFWMRLYLGPAATVDKTRVFYTCQPLIKRCVHALAPRRAGRGRNRANLAPSPPAPPPGRRRAASAQRAR